MTGGIPAELGYVAGLEFLDLSENQLTGEIPAELGYVASLEYLNLSQNQLTGDIPEVIRRLVFRVDTLNLRGNQFTGCIDEMWRSTYLIDVDELGLPFCDVLLNGLTLTPGSLFPSFDPYHTKYTSAVGRSRVTVAPSRDHNASILLFDENAQVVEDVDGMLEGHQIDFSADLPAVKIRVVSEDSLASHTYTISDLGIRYDTDENGVIDRDEVVAAIIDYFDDRITRDETIAVIRLYFSR